MEGKLPKGNFFTYSQKQLNYNLILLSRVMLICISVLVMLDISEGTR